MLSYDEVQSLLDTPEGKAALAANQPAQAAPQQNPFMAALKRSGAGMVGDIGTLVDQAGQSLGSSGLSLVGQGLRVYDQGVEAANPAQTSLTSVSDLVNKPGTWLAEAAGTALPYFVPVGLGAKVGLRGAGIASKALGGADVVGDAATALKAAKVAGEGVGDAKTALSAARSQFANTAVGKAGAFTGATLAQTPFLAGEAAQFQQENGDPVNLGQDFAYAIPNAALQSVAGIGGLVAKGVTRGLAIPAEQAVAKGAAPSLLRIPAKMAGTAAEQGAIGAANTASLYTMTAPDTQTGVDRLSTPEGINNLVGSAVGGAVLGGLLRGPHAVMENMALSRAARDAADRTAATSVYQAATSVDQAATAAPQVVQPQQMTLDGFAPLTRESAARDSRDAWQQEQAAGAVKTQQDIISNLDSQPVLTPEQEALRASAQSTIDAFSPPKTTDTAAPEQISMLADLERAIPPATLDEAHAQMNSALADQTLAAPDKLAAVKAFQDMAARDTSTDVNSTLLRQQAPKIGEAALANIATSERQRVYSQFDESARNNDVAAAEAAHAELTPLSPPAQVAAREQTLNQLHTDRTNSALASAKDVFARHYTTPEERTAALGQLQGLADNLPAGRGGLAPVRESALDFIAANKNNIGTTDRTAAVNEFGRVYADPKSTIQDKLKALKAWEIAPGRIDKDAQIIQSFKTALLTGEKLADVGEAANTKRVMDAHMGYQREQKAAREAEVKQAIDAAASLGIDRRVVTQKSQDLYAALAKASTPEAKLAAANSLHEYHAAPDKKGKLHADAAAKLDAYIKASEGEPSPTPPTGGKVSQTKESARRQQKAAPKTELTPKSSQQVKPKAPPPVAAAKDVVTSEEVENLNHESTAAPSFIDRAESSAMRDAVQANDVAKVRGMVKDFFGKQPDMATIGKWVSSVAHDVKIAYADKIERAANGAYIHAKYNPNTHTITLNANGVDPVIVAHELIHAATERAMLRAEEAIKSGAPTVKDARLVEAYGRALKVFRDFKREFPDSKEYGLTNEREFVAETLSNPTFRSFLMTEPKGNLWGRMIGAIRRLLGLPSTAAKQLNDVFLAAQAMAYDAPGATYYPASARELYFRGVNPEFEASYQRVGQISWWDKTWSGLNASKKKFLLGVQSRHHIVERFGAQLRSLQDIVSTSNKIERLSRSLEEKSAQFSLKLINWSGKNKEAANRLIEGMELMSQMRLSRETVGKVLRGEETYDSLLKQETTRKSGSAINATRLEAMGRASFDRMVTRLKQVGWSEKYNAGKDHDKYTANDWGNNIFDLSRDVQNRHFDMMLRRNYYAVFRDLDAMNPEGKLSIAAIRDRLLNDPLVTMDIKDDVKAAIQQQDEAQHVPYIPTHRTGEYFVALKKPVEGESDGADTHQTVAMMRFTTPIEAQRYAEGLRSDKDIQARGYHVAYGMLREEMDKTTNDSRGIMRMAHRMADNIGADYAKYGMDADQSKALRDAIMQDAYRLLPENNYLKSRLHRQGIAGWKPEEQISGLMQFVARENHAYARMRHDADMQQAFEQMQHNVKQLTTPEFYADSPEFMSQKADLKARGMKMLDSVDAQMISAEMYRRYVQGMEYLDSPLITNVQRIRAFTTGYQLGLSPGYLIANLTQPYMLTLPVLGGRYGFAKSASAMMSAMRAAGIVSKEMMKRGFDNAVLSEDFVDGLRKLDYFKRPENRHMLDVIDHMLGSGKVDFGTLTRTSTELGVGEGQRSVKFNRIVSAPSQWTEVMNRLTTGIAAYTLEMNKQGKTVPLAKREEISLERALWAIDESQFDYSTANQARLVQYKGVLGPVTPLFTTFLNYSFFSMELMARNLRKAIDRDLNPAERAAARKTLAGMMFATASLAGITGLPFASPILSASQMMLDPGEDSRQNLREFFNEAFGKTGGLAADQGLVAALFGFNPQSRIGSQDMLPYSRLFTGYKSVQDQTAMDFLGNISPSFGTAYSIVNALPNAYNWVVNGQESAASATIRGLPAALRGAATAATGYYDPQGVPLPGNDSLGDKVAQSLGFTPTVRTEQMMQLMSTKRVEAQLKVAAARIKANYNAAFLEGDQKDMAHWQQEAVQFAQENPQMRGLVTGLARGAHKLMQRQAQYKTTGSVVTPASKAWAKYVADHNDIYQLQPDEESD